MEITSVGRWVLADQKAVQCLLLAFSDRPSYHLVEAARRSPLRKIALRFVAQGDLVEQAQNKHVLGSLTASA